MTFLDQAAQKIIENHPKNLHEVLVLLPSKRGELFLKRALAKHLEKPAIAPKMRTIEEFVQQASGRKKQSQLQLLIILYKVYKSTVNEDENFDSFLKWGNMLLHDFNEIDRHLVDAHQLFNNLLDVKKIESWGVEPGEKPELVKKYLKFWRQLLPLYKAFGEALKKEQKSYQGQAYRAVAEDLQRVEQALGAAEKPIYLLGFNALNKAEEIIFQHLIKSHRATAFWDADTFYFDDKKHEAGHFLRQYKSQWSVFATRPFEWVQQHFAQRKKKINIVAAPTKLGIAEAAGQVLNSLPPHEQTTTALVLADESALLPTLDAIPKDFEEINITMGLPLRHLPLAHDLHTVLRMHEQAERTLATKNSFSFHHTTFLAVVESVFFQKLLGENAAELAQKALATNAVFIGPNTAKKWLENVGCQVPEVFDLFVQPNSAKALVSALDASLKRHIENGESENEITRESAFALHKTHNQLLELLDFLGEDMALKTLSRLYKNYMTENQLDFYGEPLAGLQVMGMLETRTLDFKRVIITGMNEGILPAGKSQNSFIPFDLKRGFGLPVHHEKDAVYAYHFYRLLQRAEEIWLIYDTDESGLGAKEKSRFIAQIENELPQLAEISHAHFAPQVHEKSLVTLPHFAKDQNVLHRLQQMAERGLSPTALNVFIDDPSRFFTERVLGVNDDDDQVEETIGYDVLGNVVHESLEQLYTPLKGMVLREENLKNLLEKSGETVVEKLSELYRGNVEEGQNLLIKNVALHMVQNTIKADLERIKSNPKMPVTVHELEQEMTVETQVDGIDFPIKFRGLADRIDREGDKIYIADYKTGKFESSEISCAKGMAKMFEAGKKGKAFQVMFYAWLFAKNFGMPSGGLQAGIFSTRAPSQGFSRLKLGRKNMIVADDIADFETQLFDLVRDIFDAQKDFTAHFVDLEETETS